MSDKKVPALEVQPDKELFFKVPFTEIVVSHVTITNYQDFNISFKILSTRPERYFLNIQDKVLKPGYYLKVDVTVLPFDYQQWEEFDDELIIRCIVQPKDQEADRAVCGSCIILDLRSTVLTEKQTKPNEDVLFSVKKVDCMLKYVFKSPGMLTSSQSDSGSHCKYASLELILAELLGVREDVKLLKVNIYDNIIY
ncbi:unnamed protein product [Dicrocoelium dendriticum]|nr:unnamed protein product [Dicrocoelium dendriticum]